MKKRLTKLVSVVLSLAYAAALPFFPVAAAETGGDNLLLTKAKAIQANIPKRNAGLEIENTIDGNPQTRYGSPESATGELVVTINLKKSYDITAVAVQERYFTVGSMTSGVTVEIGTEQELIEAVTNGALQSGVANGEIVKTEFSFPAVSGNKIVFTFAPGAVKSGGESLYQLAELEAYGTPSSTGNDGEQEEVDYMTERIYNPYLPSYEYVPDGEPYVFDERVYIFGSHDKYNTTSYCDTKYVGWSAPISDLSAWRYEGIIWDAEDDPDNASNMGLYAPDVTKGTDGKYYLYYPLNGSGSIGVARCDSPAGRYEYVGKVHYADGTKYGNKAGDPPACDPAIFVDEDGKVYLYSGYTTGRKEDYDSQIANNIGADGAYCIELESDMVTVKEGTRTRIVPGKYITGETGNEAYAGNAFFEAASMRKINGKYYFIYSNEAGHQLCYATGDSPYGPFTYGGIIVCNTDVGYKGNVERKAIYGNNHGSIAEINGEYYIFYHRQTGAVGRQACAEKIEIQADGSISQVCLTSFGLGGGRPMLASGKFPAYIACNISPGAAYAQDGADGDATAMQYVSGLENGEYAGYKYFYFNDDTNTISVTAKSPAGGTLKVYTGAMLGVPAAAIALSEANEWTSYTQDVNFENGTDALFFVYEGSGTADLLDFTLGDAGTAYDVTVSGSEAAASGAGSYTAGEIVAVSAGTKEGYDFDGWTVTGGASLADINGEATTFIMPKGTVSLTANWKKAAPVPANILPISAGHVTNASVSLSAINDMLAETAMRDGSTDGTGMSIERYAASDGNQPLVITYTLDHVYDFSTVSVYERFQGYTFGDDVKIELGNVSSGTYVWQDVLTGGTLNQGPSPGNTNVAPSVRTNFAISGSGSAIRFTFTNTWTDKDGNSTGGTVAQGGKEIQVGYSFFELEAYGIKKAELPSNIALGKAVSTNLPAQYDVLPVSAITDGSYADKAMGTVGSATLYDRYSSAPSPKEALVITIDLGGTYDIGWAEFNSRYVISEGRVADAVKVEVGRSGISGTTWTTANENVTLNTGRDGEFVSTLIPFAETLTGNELRFTLSRHDYSNTTAYNVAEIMAYGVPTEGAADGADAIGSIRFTKSKSGAMTAATKIIKQAEGSVWPEKVTLILAIYQNNKLVNAEKQELTLNTGVNELSATHNTVPSGCTAKALIWNGNTLKPLIAEEHYTMQ